MQPRAIAAGRGARRARGRAMTTLEVVVTLAVVAALSTLAVVGYRSTQDRAKDRAAVEVVRSVAIDAQQLAASASRRTFTSADLADAIANLPTDRAALALRTPGAAAAGVSFAEQLGPSLAYGRISVGLGADADGATEVGIAMESRTGNCTWALAGVRGPVSTGVWEGDLGDACRGSAVLTSTAAPAPEPPGPPSTPTGLSCAASDVTVRLAWTASPESDVAAYRVYQNGVGTLTTGPSASGASVTPLANGTAYRFQVAAVDRAGQESPLSSSVTCTPVDDAPPSTPALTATAGERSVGLDWTDAADSSPVGYRVYRDGVFVAQVTASQYVDRDRALVVGTSYTYTVIAYDTAANASARSNPASATPYDRTPPPVPDGLVVVGGLVRKVTVSWQPVITATGDLAGYRLYRLVGTTASLVYQGTGTAYDSEKVVPPMALGDGETVTFAVSSYDTTGNESAHSAAASGTTLARPARPVPTATGRIGAIDLGWPAVPGAARYEAQRSAAGANAYAPLVPGPTGPSYTDTTVAPGTTYDYQVRACNAAGCSGWAALSAAAAPAAPAVSLTVARYDITASWAGVLGAARYNVQRAQGAAAFSTRAAGLTASQFSDPGLAADTAYSYQVQACNAAGVCGPWSATKGATTAPGTPSTAASATGTTVSVSWKPTAASAVTSYQLQRNATTLALSSATATSYSDANRAKATTYSYTTRACNAAGCSDWSPPASATTVPNPPPISGGCDPWDGVHRGDGSGRCSFSYAAPAATSYALKFFDARCYPIYSPVPCSPAWSDPNRLSGSVSGLQGYLGRQNGIEVNACNAAGCAGAFATVEATPRPTGLRGVPQGCGWDGGWMCTLWVAARWATSYEVHFWQGTGGNWVSCVPGCWGWTGDDTLWSAHPQSATEASAHLADCTRPDGGCGSSITVREFDQQFLGFWARWDVQPANYWYCTPPGPDIAPTERCDEPKTYLQF